MHSADHTLVVTNSGHISDSGWAGVHAMNDSLTSLTNSGTIDGVEGGIYFYNGTSIGSITNNAGATIRANEPMLFGGHGIWLHDAVQADEITNAGLIDGFADGIHLEDSDVDSITNEATGTISGGYSGLYMHGGNSDAITNAGLIEGTDMMGIWASTDANIGAIDNQASGTITGGSDGIYLSEVEIGSITNSGSIIGHDYNGMIIEDSLVTGSIINETTGVIESRNYGDGIMLTDGTSVGGNIENKGSILLTNNTISRTAGITLFDASVDGDIINSGNISVNSASPYGNVVGIRLDNSTANAISNEATGTIEANLSAIHLDSNASISNGITNRGRLASNLSYSAITLYNGSSVEGGIHNEAGATIYSSGYHGIESNSSSIYDGIHNEGDIIANSGRGIRISGGTFTGDIVNDGTIDGGEGGIFFSSTTVAGDIINNDSIWGGSEGIYIGDSEYIGTITNNSYIGGGSHSIYTEYNYDPIIINNYGELDGAIYIQGATLNIEDGSILTSHIDGDGGIVNINTNFSTENDMGDNEALKEINIAAGRNFTALGSNYFNATDFTNNGALSILQGETVEITGNYYQGPNASLRVQANSLNNYGKLLVNGDALFEHSNIFVDVTNGAQFSNADALTHVIEATGSLSADPFNVTDNSHLYNFSAYTHGNQVDLVATADSSTSVFQSVLNQGNMPGTGAAVNIDKILALVPSGDVASVQNAFGSLNTEQQISVAVGQTLPVLVGGSTTSVIQTMNTTSQVIEARQSDNIGLSSGNDYLSSGHLWVKPFGTWSDQGTKDNVTGFNARSYGFVGGVDGTVSDAWRVGTALTYANANVDSDNSLNALDINSYQATAYASYSLDPRTEANFQLGAGYNDNDSTRIINFGGLNRVAKGEFGSYSLHAGTGIGRRYDLGSSTTLTPSARLDYQLIANESYTESDAGALNLRVKSQSTDQLIPALQAKLNHSIEQDFILSANAGVGYDLLNGPNSVTASYVGGGSAFVTTGLEPSPWLVRTGLGLTYKPSDAYDVTLRYDREDRGSDFDTQSATAKLRLPF